MKSAVIGLGYVGLPLAVETALCGFEVIGIDVNPEKVAMVNRGKSYIDDVTSKTLRQVVKANTLEATTDFSRVKEARALSICVPTPLSKMKDPDISYIVDAVERIVPIFGRGRLLCLKVPHFPEPLKR
jgi:UDP-N-acetyl-D-glucosamine dehydrogenase